MRYEYDAVLRAVRKVKDGMDTVRAFPVTENRSRSDPIEVEESRAWRQSITWLSASTEIMPG